MPPAPPRTCHGGITGLWLPCPQQGHHSLTSENRISFNYHYTLQNAILLQFFGDLDSACFHTWKDVVIPPLVSDPAVLSWVREDAYVDVGAKPVGLYFRGKLEWKQKNPTPEYGHGVRQALHLASKSDPFFSINTGAIPHEECVRSQRNRLLPCPGQSVPVQRQRPHVQHRVQQIVYKLQVGPSHRR